MSSSGDGRTFKADHVISATGYRIDLRKLSLLEEGLMAAIGSVDRTPVLSANFESTIPGLYFCGPVAANTFGPVMRFVLGAEFAAPRIAHRLKRILVANRAT